MKRAVFTGIFTACLALVSTCVVLSQAMQTTGRIEGTVRDQTGGVIPGVTVTITSDTGTKTMVTGDSGGFAFPFLIPGLYDLKAELEGFKAYEQDGMLVRLGVALTLNLVLTPGEISEVVTVTGEAPLVDVTTTTIGANISDSLYAAVPVRRNFINLFNMAPGVSESFAGASNPSIGGASGLENTYVIDGVNVTNTGYGSLGAFSNVYGSLGTGVNFDFVKEIQVKSGGFEAEYGGSDGGVINVITKSGGNEFHGGVYFYGQPAGWQAARSQPDNYRVDQLSMMLSQQAFDIGMDLSGYLWKDKFFFYAAFDPTFNTDYLRAPEGYGQDVDGLKLYERETHHFTWSAKCTFVPWSNHNFEFSSFADPSNRSLGPNRNMLTTGDSNYSKLHFGGWNLVARYNGVITNSWFLTAAYSRAFNRFQEDFLYDTWNIRDYVGWFYDHNPPGTQPTRNPSSYYRTGGIGFFENNNGENNAFNIKTTINFSAGGEHTLDAGYVYEDVRYAAVRRYTGPEVNVPAFGTFPGGTTYGGMFRNLWFRQANGAMWDRNSDGVIDANDSVWWQLRGNTNVPSVATTTRYDSFFIQDAWKISPNVTFKAGLRYDYQKIEGGGASSSGHTFDGNWAPRLGLIYDLRGDGKTKIYGSWGRFFQKIPQDLAVRALSVEVGLSSVYWGDADMTQFLNQTMVEAGLTPYPGMGDPATVGLAGGTPTVIYPGTAAMFQDEFVLGVDREINSTLSVGARYIWRHVGRGMEDCGSMTPEQYNGASPSDGEYQYVIANPSAAMDIFDNARGILGSDGIPDGFGDMVRTYNAFEFTLEKRFSQGLQFMMNYRLSKLWGDWDGLLRTDNSQTDPLISSLYDFRQDPQTKSLGYCYVPGYLNTDRTHVLNFNGSYTFPNKITLGLGARLISGYPLTPLGTHPASGYGDKEIPLTTRGSAGRSDWINIVDIHADYPFHFGDRYRLRFAVDLFNVFNLKKVSLVDNQAEANGEPYADYLAPAAFQAPFSARFSARFEF